MDATDAEARAFWEEHHHITDDPAFWMAEPKCREAINRRVSGDPFVWPLEHFRMYVGRRFRRGLSLGCGLGNLERVVRQMDLCEQIDGVDVSEASLEKARAAAVAEGLTGISYRLDNFNTLRLPHGRYDAVFFHQSLHHVRPVEKLLARVERAMTPDGIIFLDEWTGPSRTEWTDERLTRLRSLYAELPQSWKRFPILKKPIEAYDPSEAVRSSAILPAVRRLFHVLGEWAYGGQLISVILPQLSREHVSQMDREALIERLLRLEDQDLSQDPSRSFHTVLVAARRRGFRRAVGHLQILAVRLQLAARYRIPTAWRILTGKHVPPEATPPESRNW
jgi:SAM-dependent methyltransferase